MAETIPILLKSCTTYEHRRLKELCAEALQEMGETRSYQGQKVLLKPNLISSRAPRLACSEAAFIKAVAEWFVDAGARVLIGDSPAFGSAAQVLKKHRIWPEIKTLGLEIVEFKTPREQLLTHGVRVGVAEEALACDLFVNLPRVKAHSQMFVTIAVKNFFGIVCGMKKAMCHMKNGLSHRKFGDLMLDLSQIVPHSISLVDGIEVMHKRGPVNGELMGLGCFCAGRDPVAIDTALLAALELDQRRSPVWRAAQQRNLAGSRMGDIDFSDLSPDYFAGSGFVAPTLLNPVPFNPVRFLVNALRRAKKAA
jgi:uncharacterized protein (DUF362 family)